MKKRILIMGLVLLFSLSLINAISQQEIDEAKNLIDSKISCDILTNEQLEILGEYYMEQMHPGEAHELMHQMMKLEEDSDAEKQFHINMTKTIYCNENVSTSYGMMGGNMMSSGMMGNSGSGFSYWNFIIILYIILLIGLIILVYVWIVKLWKNMKNKGGRK